MAASPAARAIWQGERVQFGRIFTHILSLLGDGRWVGRCDARNCRCSKQSGVGKSMRKVRTQRQAMEFAQLGESREMLGGVKSLCMDITATTPSPLLGSNIDHFPLTFTTSLILA